MGVLYIHLLTRQKRHHLSYVLELDSEEDELDSLDALEALEGELLELDALDALDALDGLLLELEDGLLLELEDELLLELDEELEEAPAGGGENDANSPAYAPSVISRLVLLAPAVA